MSELERCRERVQALEDVLRGLIALSGLEGPHVAQVYERMAADIRGRLGEARAARDRVEAREEGHEALEELGLTFGVYPGGDYYLRKLGGDILPGIYEDSHQALAAAARMRRTKNGS